jgi:hypothetical protein
VFWTRSRRQARRQQVLDELLALDPAQRRDRLDLAVAVGDVRADEVDEALMLVHRLDLLRVMTIPPSGRLPGGVLPIRERPAKESDAGAAVEMAGSVVSALPEVASTEADAAQRSGGPIAPPTRSGARSSRRRRGGRHITGPLRATQPAPAPVEESWPSIEWLRP